MTKFKALYKGMYDDLKDADMMICYAYEIREEGDENLAEVLAKYARERLDHLHSFHKIFVEETQAVEVPKETVHFCLWEETHEHMMEWEREISKKISEF